MLFSSGQPVSSITSRMELALQVVGLKMTGKIEDARHIALRIVGNTGGPEPEQHAGMSAGGAMQLSSHLLLGRAGDNGDFEKVLLDFLALLSVPTVHAVIPNETSISKQTSSGQTLLHLAVLAKFPSLVKFLISQGIDIDARDNNGCTALFLAALTGSRECARALVDAGAALDVVNAAGKTPAEVGPTSFFDFVASESEPSSSEGGERDSDEAAWGDAEEESDNEAERQSTLRRRRGRRLGRVLKPRSGAATTAVEVSSSPESDHKPSSAAAEKKAIEAGLAAAADEKQAATFVEMVYRTLAQLQNPQGIIPNMPNIPYLHMPNLPGMPTWGALPQIPAVFPVLVPIPYLWGDRRTTTRGDADDKDGAEPKFGFANAVDFRSFWEKRMQQMTRGDDAHDNPPPAYTPRGADPVVFDPDAKAPVPEPEAQPSVVVPTPQPEPEVGAEAEAETRLVAPATALAPAPRQVGYDEAAVPEEEVQLYGYRPARKAPRWAQKKRTCYLCQCFGLRVWLTVDSACVDDRMLVLFWIPILIISFAWAFVHALKIALHATKALVMIKVGLQA